jgi:methylenetetrahydrofolate--tRNA-(uracil-5-)-methyltransferase
MGNIATGLLAGVNAARFLFGQSPLEFPNDTMLGALCHYVTHAEMKNFQPMKANFGLLPPLQSVPSKSTKRDRAAQYSERAKLSLLNYLKISHEK